MDKLTSKIMLHCLFDISCNLFSVIFLMDRSFQIPDSVEEILLFVQNIKEHLIMRKHSCDE